MVNDSLQNQPKSNFGNLFQKKSIANLLSESEIAVGTGSESPSGKVGLKRSLNAYHLTAIGIGMIIGAGLFSLTGIAAADYAGPAVTLSFLLAGIGCAFSGLCYAEFASMIPVSGSAYTYTYATMGELLAWIIGWDLILEYTVGAATVAISWSQYFTKFLHYFGVGIPPQFSLSPFETATLANGQIVHGIFNLPAVAIVVLISLLLIKGTRESAWVTSAIVILKITVVLVFIIVGYRFIDVKNYQNYIPRNTGVFGEFGISGIFRGAGIVFFAFIGFDAVSTAGLEAKNPKKDLPIGILASLIVCTILYILFAHVMTGMANFKEFKNSAAPVAIAIGKTPYPWLQISIIVAILAGYSSVILVDLMAQSRIFYSMSQDGLLPKLFSEIHPTFHTPYKSNILLGIFVALFAALVPVHIVGEMTSIGTLFAFILVCLGVWMLRHKAPEIPRSFKLPFMPLIPILGILTCSLMMVTLPGPTWIRLIIWLTLGLIIYFTYSIKHSRIRNN